MAETVDRYVLHEEIASGGVATVWLGRLDGAPGFSRVVAVKRLHPHLARDAKLGAAFLDEARMAVRVRHPNVVPVTDVVASGGELLIVMDHVPGATLAELAEGAGERAALPIVSAILVDVLRGLAAAHDATDANGARIHLVHRDVSPQNVLVGADGITRLLDFGIAKARGRSQVTDDGTIRGKAAYMAPEQLVGDADPRTDLWATSAVAWELVRGERLFAGENDHATFQAVLAKEIPSLGDDAFSMAIRRGLERSPLDRWADATSYADALVAAVPPAPAAEVAAWVARRRGPELAARAERVRLVEAMIAPRKPRRWPIAAGVAAVLAGAIALWPRHAARPATVVTAPPEPAPAVSEARVDPAPPLPRSAPAKAGARPAPPRKKAANVCSYIEDGIVKFRPCS